MATSELPRVQTGVLRILRERAALPMSVMATLHDVQVVQELNVPSMFSFTLSAQSERGAWQGVDLELFKPGDEITVFLGLDTARELITGNVTAVEPSFDDYATVTVRGFDRMVRLRFGTHTRSFERLDDNEIVRQVARSAGLVAQADGDTGTVNDYVLQNNQTNLAFLLQRCELLDHELLMAGTTLRFRPSAEGRGPARTLNYPRDLSRVALALKVPTQGERVSVTGYDVRSNQYLTAHSRPGGADDLMGGRRTGFQQASDFPDSAVALERPDLVTAQALQEVADAQYQRYLNRFIEGSASVLGDPALSAGINLRLTGLSTRFNGLYYVTQATHRFDDTSGYRTDLQLRRSGA